MIENRTYWNRLCSLPAYSFLLSDLLSICRVNDKYGNWLEKHQVQEIVDDAEVKIHELRSALGGFMTYYGMDEDGWSRPVFDKAREALK